MSPQMLEEKIITFWCEPCQAKIPCRSRKWRARRRQHQAVHDRYAEQRAKVAARA